MQGSGKKKVFRSLSIVPWWNLFRILSIALLAGVVVLPFFELEAMQSSVVFSKGRMATIAWDPPTEGVVDHYVIEVTTSKQLAGPSNVITWVDHFTSKDNSFTISTRDGYTYSLRVKAVGPSGNESPYSDDQLVIICDSSSPNISILPVGSDNTRAFGDNYIHLTGNFSDENLAEILVEGKKATLDFTNNTWYVTIPIGNNTNLITVTARDYAGNVISKQFQVRKTPLVINTDPGNGDIFVMGTPSYPGIFFSNKAVTLQEVMEPDLHLPITIEKTGYMQLNTVLSLQDGQDVITLSLSPLRSPIYFVSHRIIAPSMGNISIAPYIFIADMDLDGQQDIIAAYPGYGAFIIKLSGEVTDADWKASPLDLRMGKEKADIDGQLFYIDYDGDLQYELLGPSSQDGEIHIFEHNGMKWVSETEWVVHFANDPGGTRVFGFLNWNDDHNKDIFLRFEGEEMVHVFENQGTDIEPYFSDADLTFPLVDLAPSSTVSTCDWNSDGRVDFIGKDTLGRLCVWLDTDNGGEVDFVKTLLPISRDSLLGNVFSISAADWNHDGIYDLVVGTDTGDIFLLIGRQE